MKTLRPNDSQRLDALLTAFNHLLANQDKLEKRLALLEKSMLAQEQAVEIPTLEIPVPLQTEPPEITAQKIETEPEPEQPRPNRATLESKVGLTLVNRIGVITLVLGIAFFFKWAVDNNWIGPAGRVVLGLVAGLITLAAADLLWRRRQQVFAQGITATGVAIVYLSLYAAFDFYHLISQPAAFAMMVATTVMAAILALRYGSFSIAALGLAAAYVTPLLLSTGQDHPWFLFSHVLLLNFAATDLAKRGKWPRLEAISFGATALIYGAWLFDRGTHIEKRLIATLAPLAFCAQRSVTQKPVLFAFSQFLTALALAAVWTKADSAFAPLALLVAGGGLAFSYLRQYPFGSFTAFAGFWLSYIPATFGSFSEHQSFISFYGVTGGFLLFLAWSCVGFALKRAAPPTLALTLFGLNGAVYYAYSYYFLGANEHIWLGPLAAVVAAVYLTFGVFIHRRSGKSAADARSATLALGIAVGFLTLAIPIQFTGFTITMAWATQGAALAWIAARLSSKLAMLAASFVFALVAFRLAVFESESLYGAQTYSLLWNRRFFTFAVSAAAMLLAAWWLSKLFKPAALAAYFGGHIFALWGLCLEIFGWSQRSVAAENRLSAETIAISILFGVYAVILVSAGVATRTAVNRFAGLGLTGIAILKLYLFDVWQLGRPYQISAFVILGILLLSTSFLYSHFRKLIESWWKDDQTAA